jgi:hypothetical protein
MSEDRAAGKLSRDDEMSCSQLPALFGLSPFNSPQDVLMRAISSVQRQQRGEPAKIESQDYIEAAEWGNMMENPILRELARRLGLKIEIDIDQPVRHHELELGGSLDGILYGDGRVVEHDPSKGIYVVGGGSITLDGLGVAEAKLTRVAPLDEPAPYRGPIQVQGLMMCSGLKWAAIGTLYGGTELRIYLVKPDLATQEKIRHDVIDFAARIRTFRTQGVIDFYPALSPNDAIGVYTEPEEDIPPVELKGDMADIVMQLIGARAAKAAAAKLEAQATTLIMDRMALAPVAHAIDEDGVIFAEIEWGMTNGRKAYSVAASPPSRAKSLKVRELDIGPIRGNA